jgi:rsbT co-antagonist protein RsbR
MLTGIRPEVAQTLVGLGTELRGIITHSDLQSGIAFATRQR